VRVYDESSGSYPAGSWLMRASQARGLTPAQIRHIQALPALPTKFTLVKVPAGIIMYTGVAAPIVGWGDGGATQSKMIGPPFVPRKNFINQQLIGECFLCYRTLAQTGNASGAGLQLGMSRAISPRISIGFALGAANSNFSVNERVSQGTLNTVNTALYGVATSDKLYLSGTLAYSFSNNTLNREVAVNELFNSLKSSFTSQVLSARLETGYKARIDNIKVTPYAAIEPG